MNKREFIKRTAGVLDANAVLASGSSALNPNIWDTRIRDFEEKLLIITPLAEQFDFRGAGVDYKVTIDSRPSAAGALTETVDVSISTFSTRSVTFTPTEYGAAYQLTRKEAVRAFFNVAERMTRKLGYALAEKKDGLAVAILQSCATSTVMVNSKTQTSDLASTDTLNYETITRAALTVEDLYYMPDSLLINNKVKKSILDISGVTDVSKFGTRSAIEQGLLGELFGLKIYVSPIIGTTSHVTKSIVMGRSRTGEAAFAYAIKRDPIIEREYHALGRYWDVVAHEEYDFQCLHPDAICLIASYV